MTARETIHSVLDITWHVPKKFAGKMIVFLITAVLTLLLIYGFSGYRIIRPLPVSARWKTGLWVMLGLSLAALIFTVIARHRFPGDWVSPLLPWTAYICFGFMTLIFPGILLKDIGVAVYRLAHMVLSRCRLPGKTAVQTPCGIDPSRRSFLTNAGNAALVGATVSLTGYGIGRAINGPDVARVNIPISDLPRPFHGFKIVQISDLHISMTLKEKYVRTVVDRILREKADMIVFTGDLADGNTRDLGREALPLADLDAQFGKFFVTGNHDYYSGVHQWLAWIEHLGFTPLINQHCIIEKSEARMVLAGITDYRAGRIIPGHASDPGKALKDAPTSVPRIMLAHQPKSIFQTEPHNVDLMICGHTHGGQYIPWNFMVPVDQPYVHGLHRHNSTLVYVNRGTGYWGPPMRIGAPPEITILRLEDHNLTHASYKSLPDSPRLT